MYKNMKIQFRYLAILVAFFSFSACDPMDDVYKELGLDTPSIVKDVTIELASADYKSLQDIAGVPSSVYSSAYFVDDAEAGKYIPYLLDKKYPQFDLESTVATTFNRLALDTTSLNKVVASLKAQAEYTLTDDDYKLTGEKYADFDSESDVDNFINLKFTEGTEFSVKVLKYKFYSGGAIDESRAFYRKGNKWLSNTYLISNSDYESTGHTYHDYEPKDDANLPGYFNKFLKQQTRIPSTNGALAYVAYLYYSDIDGDNKKDTYYKIMTLVFNGTDWSQTEAATLQFAKKSNGWEADISKKYTLIGSDYTWIATNAVAGSAPAKSNLGQYGNFSVSLWGTDILPAISELLNHLFPNEVVGQRYNVTYTKYDSGTTGPTSVILEKQASGEWTKAE